MFLKKITVAVSLISLGGTSTTFATRLHREKLEPSDESQRTAQFRKFLLNGLEKKKSPKEIEDRVSNIEALMEKANQKEEELETAIEHRINNRIINNEYLEENKKKLIDLENKKGEIDIEFYNRTKIFIEYRSEYIRQENKKLKLQVKKQRDELYRILLSINKEKNGLREKKTTEKGKIPRKVIIQKVVEQLKELRNRKMSSN